MEKEITMIERVARAITENQMRTANELFRLSDQRRVRTEEQIAASIETGWPINTKDARAVIEAMREPSSWMLNEAVQIYEDQKGNVAGFEYWQRMIDAALKEQGKA